MSLWTDRQMAEACRLSVSITAMRTSVSGSIKIAADRQEQRLPWREELVNSLLEVKASSLFVRHQFSLSSPQNAAVAPTFSSLRL